MIACKSHAFATVRSIISLAMKAMEVAGDMAACKVSGAVAEKSGPKAKDVKAVTTGTNLVQLAWLVPSWAT